MKVARTTNVTCLSCMHRKGRAQAVRGGVCTCSPCKQGRSVQIFIDFGIAKGWCPGNIMGGTLVAPAHCKDLGSGTQGRLGRPPCVSLSEPYILLSAPCLSLTLPLNRPGPHSAWHSSLSISSRMVSHTVELVLLLLGAALLHE